MRRARASAASGEKLLRLRPQERGRSPSGRRCGRRRRPGPRAPGCRAEEAQQHAGAGGGLRPGCRRGSGSRSSRRSRSSGAGLQGQQVELEQQGGMVLAAGQRRRPAGRPGGRGERGSEDGKVIGAVLHAVQNSAVHAWPLRRTISWMAAGVPSCPQEHRRGAEGGDLLRVQLDGE